MIHTTPSSLRRLVASSLLLASLAGCGRIRFSIDLVPDDTALTETVVMADPGASSKIALVDVSGLLINATPRIPFPTENPVARFAEALDRAAADGRVDAVLVRINSPGGGVTATDIMYRELLAFRARTGKPVVVLMADVAASGGYYLACGADEIIAHPTTITGSIGVVIQTFNFYEGMRRIGINADAIASGPNKTMGSPFAPMEPEQRQLLQGLVDEFYAGFVDVVVAGRPAIATDDIEWITDGRVVSGRQAAEIGLVDEVGGLRDAFERTKARAQLLRAKLVKYHRPLQHVATPYSEAPGQPGVTEINLLQLELAAQGDHQPGFYYLWTP